jgi:hypothetical protein
MMFVFVVFVDLTNQPQQKKGDEHLLALSSSVLGLLGTAEQTGSSGGDETGLLTLCGVSGDCGGFADMLMVTTTVRLEGGKKKVC